jgi:hypothetical protein
MVNSVLSSLPTFYMSSIKVPIDILNQIDKYRRHCLWRGGDVNAKKPPLTAWKLVCRPKNRGGFRVIRLHLQNEALLMKNLDKFFSKADLPWVKLIWPQYYSNGKIPENEMRGSFWWRSVLILLDNYKGIAKVDSGSGDTILFWQDLWNGQVLKLTYPQLHSSTKTDKVTLQTILQLDKI